MPAVDIASGCSVCSRKWSETSISANLGHWSHRYGRWLNRTQRVHRGPRFAMGSIFITRCSFLGSALRLLFYIEHMARTKKNFAIDFDLTTSNTTSTKTLWCFSGSFVLLFRLFAEHCPKCEMPLNTNDMVQKVKNVIFHQECFRFVLFLLSPQLC